MTRHRPRIRRRPRTDELDGYLYRLHCTCGVVGEEHAARRSAAWDLREHMESLPPVPADQQCQMPTEHRVEDWERCGLCAGQLTIFDALGDSPDPSHVGLPRPPATSSDATGGARRG